MSSIPPVLKDIGGLVEHLESYQVSTGVLADAWENPKAIATLAMILGDQQWLSIPRAADFLGTGTDYVRGILNRVPVKRGEGGHIRILKAGLILYVLKESDFPKEKPLVPGAQKQVKIQTVARKLLEGEKRKINSRKPEGKCL